MLDKEHKTLHGVTVTIPDHMHATVSLLTMERRLGVHCQRPLTQTVWEARRVAAAARKYKVPTQMGSQGYSAEETRIACEMIWRGDIGDISEVHAMSGGGFFRGVVEWQAAEPVPESFNWDIWTGRVQENPSRKRFLRFRKEMPRSPQGFTVWSATPCTAPGSPSLPAQGSFLQADSGSVEKETRQDRPRPGSRCRQSR